MGGEGAAEALISPASLLEALCGPGSIPLAVTLPLWSPAHAATMPLRCDAGISDEHAELRLHRSALPSVSLPLIMALASSSTSTLWTVCCLLERLCQVRW